MIVEVEYADLISLLGKSVPLQDIVNALDMFGTPVDEYDETTLRVEVFPNRPDMLGPEGISRSLKGVLGIETGLPQWKMSSSELEIDVTSTTIRPHLSFATVTGVKLTESAVKSLMQMQEKLHIGMGRNRAKFSIGIYDMDRIRFPVKYTEMPLKDISFMPLDAPTGEELTGQEVLTQTEKGRDFAHLLPKNPRKAPVMVDAMDRVISMPPILNADFCKVTSSTTNLLIDSTGTAPGTDRMVALIATALAERGGTINVVMPGPLFLPGRMKLDMKYIHKLTGLELNRSEVAELLKRMRFGFLDEVLIPPYRTDIMNQIDLAEDLAIAYGYQNFTHELPRMGLVGKPLKVSEFENTLRCLMVGNGFLEVKLFNLISKVDALLAGGAKVETANPKSLECSVLRPSLLPGLFGLLRSNKSADYPQRIFEIGEIFAPGQGRCLAGFITHAKAGFTEVKGVVDAIQDLTGKTAEQPTWKAGEHPMFMPGRTAISEWGVYGELLPVLSQKIGMPVAGFELRLETDL